MPFGDRVALDRHVFSPVNLGHSDTCMQDTGTGNVADAATGETVWSDETRWSFGKAMVAGDSLYTYGGSLRSYPKDGCGEPTCRPTWTEEPTGVGAIYDLAGDGSGPLVTTAPSGPAGQMMLFTIDPATGTALSSTPLPFQATSLALAQGTVYVAGDTKVAAFDVAACAAGTCVPLWQAPVGGQVTWAEGLAVAGGVVYVGRSDGVVEAFAADGCGSATCAAVHQVTAPGEVLSLAVAEGHLLVGTFGSVTAYAPG